MSEQLRQIDELNSRVKVRVAPSKIHGVGIFALRDISKGEKLYGDHFPVMYNIPYSSFGKLLPEVKEFLLERWPQVINGSLFAYPDTHLQAFCNHSFKNNYDGKADIALKDIPAGVEITEDYRDIQGWAQLYPWLVELNEKNTKKRVV